MSANSKTGGERGFHHGDLRNALMVIARRLVKQHGPEQFSLREAAREAGVSPNAAYRHFADRRALLRELAKQGFPELAIETEQAMAAAGNDPVARFRANGLAYVRFATRESDLFTLMFGPFGAGGGKEGLDMRGPASGMTGFELLGSVLDELVAAGFLAPVDRPGAEAMAWPAMHGIAVLTNAGVLPPPIEASFERVYPMLARAIGVRSLPDPPPGRALSETR